jgi:hypothetical protein
MLARVLADCLAAAGASEPGEVSQTCGGSATIRRFDHVAWLVVKGIPWLWRRGTDLLPYLLGALFGTEGRVTQAQRADILASRRDVGHRTS